MSGKNIYIPSKLLDLLIRAGIVGLMCLLIGSILFLFSPSVTLEYNTFERLEFWIILCIVGGVGIVISDVCIECFLKEIPTTLKILAQSLCGLIAVFIPLHIIFEQQDLPNMTTRIVFVWVIMLMIIAGANIFNRQMTKTKSLKDETEIVSKEPQLPKILSRLPVHYQQAELYALSAEDHYVRVHTSKGEELILIRLSDAIAETAEVIGMQTHRSWWVARSAIDDISVKNRTAEIKLINGTQTPVSRNGLKVLKQAGWV